MVPAVTVAQCYILLRRWLQPIGGLAAVPGSMLNETPCVGVSSPAGYAAALLICRIWRAQRTRSCLRGLIPAGDLSCFSQKYKGIRREFYLLLELHAELVGSLAWCDHVGPCEMAPHGLL